MKKLLLVFLLLSSNLLFGQQIIRNLQWLNVDTEIDELTIDHGLTLSAETENISDGEIVNITIWGKGNINDDLVGEYITRVYNNKITFHWTLVFERDMMQNSLYEIEEQGFTSPQYYFTAQYNRRKSEDSKLLNVMSWIRQQIVEKATNLPIINMKYKLLLSDDSEIEGWTDADGYIRHENIRVFSKVYFYFMETEEKHEITPSYQDPEKPIYYTIKENDNLWNISSFDFIYGNPYLWKTIYEYNKYNFIDQNNPNLIEVGQTLMIPSLKDEIRTGTR